MKEVLLSMLGMAAVCGVVLFLIDRYLRRPMKRYQVR